MPNLSESDRFKIIQWANRHLKIRRVYLYGSRARGDNSADSDIDLAIQMHSAPNEEPYVTWRLWHDEFMRNPDLNLDHVVHLEWYEKDVGLERIEPAVEMDGILIYESESNRNALRS